MHYCKGLVSVVTILFLLAVFNSQLNALIIPSGNSAFETADSIMGATNLIHMFARFVGAHIYLPILIPREARAEGPSVARLINLSGRAGPSGAKPREFERKIYLYI